MGVIDDLNEECGVFAFTGENAVPKTIRALSFLVNRGRQSTGVAYVDNDGVIKIVKGVGTPRKVFTNFNLGDVDSHFAIGGTRYATSGINLERDAKPIGVNLYLPRGKISLEEAVLENYERGVLQIAADHNGDSPFFLDIRERGMKDGFKFRTGNDLESFLYLQSKEIVNLHNKGIVDYDLLIKKSIESAAKEWGGSLSLVELVVFPDGTPSVYAFREKHGIKPLVFGYNHSSTHEYGIASESLPLEVLGFDLKNVFDFPIGSILRLDGQSFERKDVFAAEPKLCLFEYAYFANATSVINGIPVSEFRKNLGRLAAIDLKNEEIEVDGVVPIPETGRSYAISMAQELGVPYFEDYVMRNRYVSERAFQEDPKSRKKVQNDKYIISSSIRYNPVPKRLMIVDDSIVRGDTLKHIISRLRQKHPEVEWVGVYSMFPKIVNICPYGIDMKRPEKLIAYDIEHKRVRDDEEIAGLLGVDFVRYVDHKMSAIALGIDEGKLCMGCTLSKYPYELPSIDKISNERRIAQDYSNN
jgi:amidophosphoribosyltransferase